MANVATTVFVTANPIIWTNPSNIGGNESGIPMGLLHFKAVTPIPAKDALNTSEVTWNCTLPRNFVYRLAWFNFTLQVAEIGNFNTSLRMQNLVAADATRPSGIWMIGPSIAIVAAPGVIQGAYNVGTNNVGIGDPSRIWIDAQAGSGNSEIKLMDIHADATSAGSGRLDTAWYIYTVDALNSWRFNSPTLVTGS